MVRNEAKTKSARRALRDLPNNIQTNNNTKNNCGRFSKSKNTSTKKSTVEKEIVKQQLHEQEQEQGEGEDYLDSLLLVQSDLSSLTRQIDELVAQVFKVKTATSKQGGGGRSEIESFSHFLSDMLSSLKPWVPRFQKALSNTNPSGDYKTSITVNEDDEKFEVESPKQTGRTSLISPSPLVSWRVADYNIDRGRQLFLLTPPLPPMSKTALSSIPMDDMSKSASFLTFSQDADDDDDLLNQRPCDSVVTKAKPTLDSQCGVSSPVCTKTDQSSSTLVMTPARLNMSPPKSCVLLEPFSDRHKSMPLKSTPFPLGMLSQISESSSSSSDSGASSEGLAFKYPELLGIQHPCNNNSKFGKKELQASPSWFFSPLKTCVLLEPPDDKSPDTAAIDPHLNHQTNSSSLKDDSDKAGCNQEPIVNNLPLVESTPLWKEPESTMRKGNCPGENTLKKELWTRFEAASSYGFRSNVSALQRTAQKGFLDMLDEVSCDGESPLADDGCLR